MSIQYLIQRQINKQKWDECIDNSANGLIYAYSFYLDRMAKQWDALVLNDYEVVMPLTWNRKYGIHYLYQPPFTACLGVFGNAITADLLNDFLVSIPAKFKYWDISFNSGNYFQLPGFNLQERMNYVLSLEENYTGLSGRFRENIKRNIRKSEQLAVAVKKNIDPEKVFELAEEQAGRFTNLRAHDFEQFGKLFTHLNKRGKAITYAAYSPDKQLMASAIFFFSHKRAYYILVGNDPNGKSMGASHALINAFIKEHAGQDIVLDFEGSDIPSLAFFYSSFGATPEKYSAIRLNRLPALIKWMK